MRYRFLTLFVALLATMLIYPALRGPGGSVFASNLLITAICAAGARVMLGETRYGALKMLIAAPPALGAWLGYFATGDASSILIVFVHVAAICFFVFMLYVALRSVYREPKISADGVFAAMCGYILLGVAFGHAYDILETLQPGSFRTDLPLNRSNQHLVLTYFSFITFATVGYGDVTPVMPFARSLAMVEAIVGQFYIAVLVADLIGKREGHAGCSVSPARFRSANRPLRHFPPVSLPTFKCRPAPTGSPWFLA
jgi:hypothetical protein